MAFDLNSASIRKIVRDTAANQYATVQLSEKSAVDPQPVATIKFVPEEKPPAPRRQTARPTPKPAPSSDGPFSSLFEVLVDELLGVEVDEVTASNEMLRCRVQKEQKTSPPGPDNCPSVY
ncbi:MAG TPA: hypothetical protein VFS58_07105 [Steroidobacteraceae bacterium]|nr:hypothetical protein [Steroidobacteraceae bacterium]